MKGRFIKISVALILCGFVFGFAQYQSVFSARDQEINYLLTWQDDAFYKASNTAEWTNDLGIQFWVEQAYFNSVRVELLPCEQETAVSPLYLLPQQTHAGHGDTNINPSRVAEPTIESILNPQSNPFGQTIIEADAYCEAHYLIAAATNSSQNLPATINMNGSTIYISGSYQTAAMETAVSSFTINSNLAWGVILPLQDGTGNRINTESLSSLQISIERQLAPLFDGLDPSKNSEQEMGMSLLRNIANNTNIHIAESNQ